VYFVLRYFAPLPFIARSFRFLWLVSHGYTVTVDDDDDANPLATPATYPVCANKSIVGGLPLD
jgi:hypothetical protein